MELELDAEEMRSHSGIYTGEGTKAASSASSASDTFLSPPDMANKDTQKNQVSCPSLSMARLLCGLGKIFNLSGPLFLHL